MPLLPGFELSPTSLANPAVHDRSPRRTSVSPHRTDYHSGRPRSRSRSPRRAQSRSPSPRQPSKSEDHAPTDWHFPRSPERTPKQSRKSHSLTPSPSQRKASPHHQEVQQEQHPTAVTSPRSGRQPDTETKVKPVLEDTTERKVAVPVPETAMEFKPPHQRRSPPRGPRNHAKPSTSMAPPHQSIPPSKPERPGRSNAPNDSVLSMIEKYKPCRNVGIDAEVSSSLECFIGVDTTPYSDRSVTGTPCQPKIGVRANWTRSASGPARIGHVHD